jgi:hypothetical protein
MNRPFLAGRLLSFLLALAPLPALAATPNAQSCPQACAQIFSICIRQKGLSAGTFLQCRHLQYECAEKCERGFRRRAAS